jgi:hypothetical protein
MIVTVNQEFQIDYVIKHIINQGEAKKGCYKS